MTDQLEETISFNGLDEILAQLNNNQLRYVSIRQMYSTDKEAAEAIGMSVATVWNWPGIVKEAVRLMAQDGVHAAREMRRRALPKAMAVKVAALDSDDETTRQKASTEIIEWEMGKATQPTEAKFTGEITIKGFEEMIARVYGNDNP